MARRFSLLHRFSRGIVALGILGICCDIMVAETASVDSRVFGLLALGISAEEVQQRLGPPDKIMPQSKQIRGTMYRGQVALHEVERVVWFYSGEGRLMDTFLTIENGVLIAKDKRR